uniref:cingulin-like isoform X2 n=1 Tax=Scatophagus argus TaxID=75038 RepID=UPI001ED845F8|nr:cingulin-like isoform X2 [Scatophagus argus]
MMINSSLLEASQGQLEASVPQEDSVRTGLEDVQMRAGVPPELPVLWDELWGLKELVLSLKAVEVEQRQALRSMESRLRDREVEAEQQRRSLEGLQETSVHQREELLQLNSDLRRKVKEVEEQSGAQAVDFSSEVSTLQSRLNSSESSVEELKRKSTALSAELPYLQTRLRASESTVEQLRRKSAVLAVRLCNAESVMEELTKQISAFPASNSSAPAEVFELERRLNVRPEGLDTSTQGQLSDLSSRLNSSQRHLDELSRSAADQTGRLKSVERRVDELQTENTALTDRLSVAERHLDELLTQATGQADTVKQLQTDGADQTSKLMNLQRKLNVTESLLDAVSAELEVRLGVSETHLDHLKTEHAELEVRLRSTETQLEQLENHTAALEVRLSVGEKHLDDLKTEHTVQSVQLSLMESRLTDGHNNTTELEIRLSVGEKQLEHLKTEHAVLSFRLNESEVRLQKLTDTNSDELNVAFSAGLTDSGSVGPFDEETTLIFSKMITNVGQAYNQTAGVFTAPVRGLYFFIFTVADYLKGYMGLYLYWNNQPIIFNLELNDHGGYASMSNGVVLRLEEGDVIRLSLPASYRLYDDSRNFTIFSGFLLFPL